MVFVFKLWVLSARFYTERANRGHWLLRKNYETTVYAWYAGVTPGTIP